MKKKLKKTDNIYKNVRIYLENQLSNMSLFIDYFPEIKDFFLSPLDTLFTSTKNASGISFNALYLDGKNINEALTNLYNDIKNNENNIILEISEITKTEIDNFIFDIQNKIDSITESSKNFFPQVIEDIKYQLKLLEDGYLINNFEFDICTYYDIIDSLNEIEKIYHKYSYGIEHAIKSENLTF